MDELIVILLGILLFVGIMFLARRHEVKKWNNGFCKKSGYPWKYFDTDSQGGRGYKDGMGNCVWISYPGVEKKKKESTH